MFVVLNDDAEQSGQTGGGKMESASIDEGWNFNSGNYLFTTDTK